MKKLLWAFTVLLLAVPAFSADWAFYGSQRVAIWYNDRDYGDGTSVSGEKDDQMTEMYFHPNSRLGAKVKADRVSGQIELGLGPGAKTGDGADGGVVTRRAYGEWKIDSTFRLKVGKDYSPVTDFISNQWWEGDNSALGTGVFYGRRPALVQLSIGEFDLAFLPPSYGGDLNTTANGTNGATGNTDPDSYIPRVEAAYQLKLGPGYIRPFGGFQYYTVKPGASTVVTDEFDVWSWVAGVSTSWDIGAFSIGGQVSYGMNVGNVQGWWPGVNARSSSQAYLDNGDDVANVYTLQAIIVPALKVSDTLRLELGVGYRVDNADDAPGYSQKDGSWLAYLNAMITLAPGVYLCPEVGYIDFMDGVNGQDQGYQWYAGAKWQIDF